MRIVIPQLDPTDPEGFPSSGRALAYPNGLLAYGGDLSVGRLLAAYRRGIFPWFNPGEPPLWWTPDPRLVLASDGFKLSRSLRKRLRQLPWTIHADRDFAAVMRACAAPRADQEGTWISPLMLRAYRELHRLGHAHSVEVWAGEDLIGGLYGVAVGRMFYGESMFSRASDASKVALLALCRQLQDWDWPLIDCQVETPHLLSLGAHTLPRSQFEAAIATQTAREGRVGSWRAAWRFVEVGTLVGSGVGD